MVKMGRRNIIRAARIERTADIAGVSSSLVRKVIDGVRNNEKVLTVYMELQEGENALVKHIKEIIPFD